MIKPKKELTIEQTAIIDHYYSAIRELERAGVISDRFGNYLSAEMVSYTDYEGDAFI
jgi:hypothetical protein